MQTETCGGRWTTEAEQLTGRGRRRRDDRPRVDDETGLVCLIHRVRPVIDGGAFALAVGHWVGERLGQRHLEVGHAHLPSRHTASARYAPRGFARISAVDIGFPRGYRDRRCLSAVDAPVFQVYADTSASPKASMVVVGCRAIDASLLTVRRVIRSPNARKALSSSRYGITTQPRGKPNTLIRPDPARARTGVTGTRMPAVRLNACDTANAKRRASAR